MTSKKVMAFVLSIALISGCMGTPAVVYASEENTLDIVATEWGTNYDSVNEFTISNEAELRAFATMVNSGKDFENKIVTLANDISVDPNTAWVPIGSSTTPTAAETKSAFAGTFDGADHQITGLVTTYENNGPIYNCGGFFGCVTGTVKNLTLTNVSFVTAYADFGGIVGYLGNGAVVDRCHVSGTISGIDWNGSPFGNTTGGIAGRSYGTISDCVNECTLSNLTNDVGGIVGSLNHGNTGEDCQVINCINNGAIECNKSVGGIVGSATDSQITGCTNNGNITTEGTSTINETQGDRIGGIVGDTLDNVVINQCQNNGVISASGFNMVGGIVGYLYDGTSAVDCVNSGTITGTNQVGGIVGSAASTTNKGYTVDSCENSGAVSGTEKVGGIVGSAGSNNSSAADAAAAVMNCTNSANISGTSSIGGIVGDNNDQAISYKGPTQVIGNLNTGNVPQNGGAIVGNNTSHTNGGSSEAGVVQNNFWPEELGTNAVGSGAGSSSSSSDAVSNNSSYNSTTGKLNTEVTIDGQTISNLGEALNKVLGEDANIPEAMQVTATFDNGGHGTTQESKTVTIGTQITLPTLTDDAYTFTGWSDGTTNYQPGATVTLMQDTTFTAQWTLTPVPATGITLDRTSLSLYRNSSPSTATLTATLTPANSTDTVTWTSSDETVATVNNGVVTAVGNGTATITATAGDYSATCEVRVSTYVAPSTPDPTPTPEPEPETPDVTTDDNAGTTETTAKPDVTVSGGTAAATVSDEMGDEIVNQATENDSVTVIIAPEMDDDVTSTEVTLPSATVDSIGTETNADIVISTPVADVTLPNGGLSDLASAGGDITVSASVDGNTVQFSVTANGEPVTEVTGGVTLIVPASDTTAGTVAVIVYDDGTREVVRKSVAGDDSVTIPLSGSATVEIVDNSKDFDDVSAGAWYSDVVDFASSHELFNGTSATTFSPNDAMTRGMLAAVLANLESADVSGMQSAFNDVHDDAWYSESVAWAAEHGIVNGYGDGAFGPNDAITREQLAAMLYNYADMLGLDTTARASLAGYNDQPSAWATDVMQWAVAKGLITGTSSDTLDPQGTATRVQVAAMLQRFIENVL